MNIKYNRGSCEFYALRSSALEQRTCNRETAVWCRLKLAAAAKKERNTHTHTSCFGKKEVFQKDSAAPILRLNFPQALAVLTQWEREERCYRSWKVHCREREGSFANAKKLHSNRDPLMSSDKFKGLIWRIVLSLDVTEWQICSVSLSPSQTDSNFNIRLQILYSHIKYSTWPTFALIWCCLLDFWSPNYAFFIKLSAFGPVFPHYCFIGLAVPVSQLPKQRPTIGSQEISQRWRKSACCQKRTSEEWRS